jgi:fructoselysine-6-P-deglycase FrlB-like protein
MSTTEQELFDQPRCWRLAAAVAARVAPVLPAGTERVAAIGCGTSFFMSASYAALRESMGAGETDAFPASEMPTARRYDRVIAISRSGTTTEVLDALDRLPAGTPAVAITGTPGSPILDGAGEGVVVDFADERSVVQTRFATSVLALLRANLGQDIEPLARAAESALRAELPVDPAAYRQFVFLGTAFGVGIAHEAALKMRETSGAWTESYPAMEFRHGPISTIGERSVVWSLGPAPEGLADEARAGGATLVESTGDPMVSLLLVQRTGVRLAHALGLDPDHPRLLSRSVILSGSTQD